jgi:hypothetical protein
MYFRKYGSSTDWSGGGAHEVGFSDSGNIWHRYGSSTSWGTWYKIWDTSNLTNLNQLTNGPGYITSSSNISGTSAGINVSNPVLATASESNSIYVTSPSYTTGQITKPLIFDWYGNYWTIGNVRSGATPSSGFGIGFQSITPTHIFTTTALTINGNTALHAGNYTSYSPTLTGGSASGTWSINITGSAGSATSATSATQVTTIQDTAPSGASGKLWWQSSTGKLKVYYGSAWVDASPIPDTSLYYPKAGGSITGDVSIQQTLNVVGNTLVQGNISSYGDIVAYSSSDSRLKDNITVIESPLEKVSKISGVSFNWNKEQSVYEVGKKDYGVIAQEIEEILPELVTTRDNGYKAVRYEKIVALLIESTKEQQTQISELKDLVNKLTEKINNLQNGN